jgi:hypothetical protein
VFNPVLPHGARHTQLIVAYVVRHFHAGEQVVTVHFVVRQKAILLIEAYDHIGVLDQALVSNVCGRATIGRQASI